MNASAERKLNQEAYRRQKQAIDNKYQRGRFVAILHGRIQADAGDFDALSAALRAAGKDVTEALVIQAGVAYPETAVIFVDGRA